eukprot:XP_001707959.1 Hypothetical protein GL50803_7015 [Giardia lamblia ATCC 50803]
MSVIENLLATIKTEQAEARIDAFQASAGKLERIYSTKEK